MFRFGRAIQNVFLVLCPALVFGASLLPYDGISFLLWAAASVVGGSVVYVVLGHRSDSVILGQAGRMASSETTLPTKIFEVLEHIPQAMIVLDRKKRMMYRNAQSVDLLGALPSQQDITSIIRVPDFLQAITECYQQNKAVTVEISLLSPRRVSLLVSLAPFSDMVQSSNTGSKQTPLAVLMVVQDLTLMKSIEEMRSDFVTNASHELKTPLTSMIGFIDTLIKDPEIDVSHRLEFLTIMKQQSNRMYRLVEDMLILSKIEQNEHVPPKQMVNLTHVLSESIQWLKPQAKANHMVLKRTKNKHHQQRDHDADILIKADEEQMYQMFQNLIQNAIKYSHNGDTIQIGLDVINETQVAFTVRDHGPGIQKEHIPRLTERFYRVDKGRSRELGGTGLGLAIVKHIVAHHRGQLLIESEPGQGTEFKVLLPFDKKIQKENTQR